MLKIFSGLVFFWLGSSTAESSSLSSLVEKASIEAKTLVVLSSRLRKPAVHAKAFKIYDTTVEMNRVFFPNRDPKSIEKLAVELSERVEDFEPEANKHVAVKPQFKKIEAISKKIGGKKEPAPELEGGFIKATYDTFLKARPVPSDQLSSYEKCLIESGTKMKITKNSFPLKKTETHQRIRLAKAISGCQFLLGDRLYLWTGHWVDRDLQ